MGDLLLLAVDYSLLCRKHLRALISIQPPPKKIVLSVYVLSTVMRSKDEFMPKVRDQVNVL